MSSTSTRELLSPLDQPTQTAEALAPAESAAAFAWRSWPLFDEWRRSWPVLAAVVAIAAVVGWASESIWPGVAALAAQLAALWRLWLPVRYEINADGVTQTVFGRTSDVPWASIRRCQIRRDGVLLSPDAKPGPFDSCAGSSSPGTVIARL